MRIAVVVAGLMACVEPGGVDGGAALPGALGGDAVEAAPIEVAVTPEAALAGTDLRCTTDRPAQVDWEVDGEPSGVSGPVVPADLVDGYQTWTCVARSLDGGVGTASAAVDEACRSLSPVSLAVHPYDAALDMIGSTFTVEAWAALDPSIDAPADRGITFTVLARGDLYSVEDDALDYGLRFDGAEQVEFVTGGTGDCAVLEAPVGGPGWHHLAGTFDATTGAKVLYVDGREAARCTAASRPRFAYGEVTVGGLRHDGGTSARFLGQIDEVRLSSGLRHTEAFTPSAYPHADRSTAWLLHFNEHAPFTAAFTYPGTRDHSGLGLHPEVRAAEAIPEGGASTCDVGWASAPGR